MNSSVSTFQSFFDEPLQQKSVNGGITNVLLGLTFIACFTYTINEFKEYSMRRRFKNNPNKLAKPPIVAGSLPLFGHWFGLHKDQVGFLRAAYEKYGPIFQVNILLRKIVYICDRELQEQLFYNAPEHQLSLLGVLQSMKLHLVFTDKLTAYWPKINQMLRRFIALSFPKFSPILKECAESSIESLDRTMNLEDELTRYAVTAPPKCLFNIESFEEFYKDFKRFKGVLRLIVFSSYVGPSWIINPIIKFFGKLVMSPTGAEFMNEIKKYINDPDYCRSSLLRNLMDEDFFGKQLTPFEVKNMSLLFSHKNSVNTIIYLRNVIIDIGQHPDWYAKLREECSQFVNGNSITDSKGLLQSKLLHFCILESARLNSNTIISRRTTLPYSTVGNYHVGHANEVVACGTFSMVESNYHKDSTSFNPNRFLIDKEAITPKYIGIWGSGLHQCPGKILILNTVKMFVALLVVNYNVELKADAAVKKNYFTFSPFVMKEFDAWKLTKVEK